MTDVHRIVLCRHERSDAVWDLSDCSTSGPFFF